MNVLSKDAVLGDFFSQSANELNQGIQQSKSLIQEMDLYRGWSESRDLEKSIDPLPWILDSNEIAFLRRSVLQWCRLLPLVLGDLFGRQSLVRNGYLPGGLLWDTLKFEPANVGAILPSAPSLSILRFDMVRDQGQWQLVGLGTEVPRGLGFALENRIVHSKSFLASLKPDNLARLAPFFRNLKEQWYKSTRTHKESPSIMVWTLGPKDPGYFEPVYLARYFGYPLVESRDLTVRSGSVYLKTLGGLEPVDVLLRWVTDPSVDPLHGNPGGITGVAGIMQAVRDGRIVILNTPGSGILERPELLHLVPQCSTYSIGEELSLLPRPINDFGQKDTQPFWTPRGWENYSTRLSFFAAQFSSSWEIMPGGIAEPIESTYRLQKDVWFLESTAVPQISLLPRGESASNIMRAGEMPSRVADDLHWLGRYIERAWLDARLIEYWRQLGVTGGADRDQEWESLLTGVLIDSQAIQLPADGVKPRPTLALSKDPSTWRLSLTIDEINRISGNLLDRLSIESHRILGGLRNWRIPSTPQDISKGLEELSLTIAALNGLTMENMTRTSGWIFLDMGRRLERAEWIIRTLDSVFQHPTSWDEHQNLNSQSLQLLLDIFDSGLTYRSRYRLTPSLGPVIDLLLLDESNPRSLGFQILQLTSHIGNLPRKSQRTYSSSEEKILLEVSTKLRLMDPSTVNTKELFELFTFFLGKIDQISQSIHESYLAKIESAESIQLRYKDPTE